MKDYGNEQVLVVPANKIPLWEGIKPASQEFLKLLRQNSFLTLRNEVERNPRLKQIIPYCILIHTDEKGVTRLFHAQRKPQADRELSGKWTIGLGGHINLRDKRKLYRRLQKKEISIVGLRTKNLFDVMVLNCAKRELNEEIVIDWNDVAEIKYQAILFTTADSVSKDHICISLTIRLKTQNARIREGELLKGGFFTKEEFLIFTNFCDWLHWLHTPEGVEWERKKLV